MKRSIREFLDSKKPKPTKKQLYLGAIEDLRKDFKEKKEETQRLIEQLEEFSKRESA